MKFLLLAAAVLLLLFNISWRQTDGVTRQQTSEAQVLGIQNEERTRQQQTREYWDSVIAQYPQYPDAYLQAVAVAFVQNDVGAATEYLNTLLLLDPNNEAGKRLILVVSPL